MFGQSGWALSGRYVLTPPVCVHPLAPMSPFGRFSDPSMGSLKKANRQRRPGGQHAGNFCRLGHRIDGRGSSRNFRFRYDRGSRSWLMRGLNRLGGQRKPTGALPRLQSISGHLVQKFGEPLRRRSSRHSYVFCPPQGWASCPPLLLFARAPFKSSKTAINFWTNCPGAGISPF